MIEKETKRDSIKRNLSLITVPMFANYPVGKLGREIINGPRINILFLSVNLNDLVFFFRTLPPYSNNRMESREVLGLGCSRRDGLAGCKVLMPPD